MTLRFVSCRIDPENPCIHGALRDLGDRSGSVVEVRVVPTKGVIDDVDAVVHAVGDGLVEVDFICDLDQVQLCAGRDFMNDLRYSGSVRYP